MAVYKSGTEPWKPFEGYAQAGKSGNFIIEDGIEGVTLGQYEMPKFLIDWSTGKFRNTWGVYDISQSFIPEINTGSYLLTPSAQMTAIGSYQNNAFRPTDRLSMVWKSKSGTHQYISFWFKINELYPNALYGSMILVFRNASGDEMFSIYHDADTYEIGFNWRSPGAEVDLQSTTFDPQTNIGSLTPGDWHHVVLRLSLNSDSFTQDNTVAELTDGSAIWINGRLVDKTVTTSGTGVIVHTSVNPYFSFGSNASVGLGNTSSRFYGSFGNLNILSSSNLNLAETLYKLEKWGASKLHSGIHSHPPRVQKDMLERRVKYPPAFGGLTPTYSGLGRDSFIDSLDTSWDETRPIGSYDQSSDSVPYLRLSANDPFVNHWRSETKSLFFSEDMTEFEVSDLRTEQKLYASIEPVENVEHLAFDDSLRIGQDEDSDNTYRDRIVINIPLDIQNDLTFGEVSLQTTTFGNKDYENIDYESMAFFNFQSQDFETVHTTGAPFSPSQGVLFDPSFGWEWTWKNLGRPVHASGFPANIEYEQPMAKTLDLSGYLKDDFILEGYEIIMDISQEESISITDTVENSYTDLSIFAPGLGHKIGGVTRTNEFGIPLNADGNPNEPENSLCTKIFTTFLIRQKNHKRDASVRDVNTLNIERKYLANVSTIASPAPGVLNDVRDDDWPNGVYALGGISSGSFDVSIPFDMIPTEFERELICYGQTVLVSDGLQFSKQIDEQVFSVYDPGGMVDPSWFASGDEEGLDLINREIQRKNLGSIANLLSDREQIIPIETKGIILGTDININQIVDISSNSSYESSIPEKLHKIGTIHPIDEVFLTGLAPIFDFDVQREGLYQYYFHETGWSWEGGCNPYSFIENRMIPSVIGTTERNYCKKNKHLDVDPYGYDSNFQQEYDEFTDINLRNTTDFRGSLKPKVDTDGYLLTPNDHLMLGFCNSISQIAGSYVTALNGSGEFIDPNQRLSLHQNRVTIKSAANSSVQPVLRLFGRYKRNDKFLNPTPNLSLYHNSTVNEPIASEDIKDQYEIEDISSYNSGFSDDIIGDDSEYSTKITVDLGLPYFNDSSISNNGFIGDISGSIQSVKDANFLKNGTWPEAQVDWHCTNNKVFPGMPLAANSGGDPDNISDYEFNANGENLGLFLGNYGNLDLLFSPNESLTFPHFLKFITRRTELMWNTITTGGPFGGTVHLRKGGVHIDELSESGYNFTSDPVDIGQDITLEIWDDSQSQLVNQTYVRNKSDFPSGTFATCGAAHAWQFLTIFNVIDPALTGIGWTQKKVRFVPVVIDSSFTGQPHVSNSQLLVVGDVFWFNGDGGINRGDTIAWNNNTMNRQWSDSLPENASDELRIFVVVASGEPVKATDQNGGDAVPFRSGYFDGIGVYALDNSVTTLTVQELYQKIVDVIDLECRNNPSLLLKLDETTYPTQIFNFPVNDASEAFFDESALQIQASLDSLNNNKQGLADENGTLNGIYYAPSDFVNDVWFYGTVRETNSQGLLVYTKQFLRLGITDLSDWPTVEYITEKLKENILTQYPAEEPTVRSDWEFYYSKALLVNKSVVARTSEPMPILDVYGQDSGQTRTAGYLGGLKRFSLLTGTKSYRDSRAKTFLDRLTKPIQSQGYTQYQIIPLEEWPTNTTIKPDVEMALWEIEKTTVPEYNTEIISKWDADSGTRVFSYQGAYSRLQIETTNGSVTWPPNDYTGQDELRLPLISWVQDQFPNMYQKNSNASFMTRGLGSGVGKKIKVFPRASNLQGWSPQGPISTADSMILEPLRGSRWGTMHPKAYYRNYYFSRTRYGNPIDFIGSGVDGCIDQNPINHDSGTFEGPCVLVKYYSPSNPYVLITDSELETEAEKLQFLHDSMGIVSSPFDDTEESQQNAVESPGRSTQKLGDNLKVNVVGSIGKKATYSPGNIISRIKKT